MKFGTRIAVGASLLVAIARSMPALACGSFPVCPPTRVTLLPPDAPGVSDGGVVFALVTSAGGASVVSVRLHDRAVTSLAVGTADGASLVVDRDQAMWIAEPANDRVTHWTNAGVLVDSIPLTGARDLAIYPAYPDVDGPSQLIAVATSAGAATVEPATLIVRALALEGLRSGAVSIVDPAYVAFTAANDTAANVVFAIPSGSVLQELAITSLVGPGGCVVSADDIDIAGTSGAVWDARCERVYPFAVTGGGAVQNTALTISMGGGNPVPPPWSHNQLRVNALGAFVVESSGLLGASYGAAAGTPLATIDGATVMTANEDRSTFWIAGLDSSGAPVLAWGNERAALGAPGAAVRDLFHADRAAVIDAPPTLTYYDSNASCSGGGGGGSPTPTPAPSVLQFQVAASDPDGDPVTITLPDLPASAFDPLTGTVTFTPGGSSCIRVDAVSGRYLTEANVAVGRNIAWCPISCNAGGPSCECQCSQTGARGSRSGGALQVGAAAAAMLILRRRGRR